MGLLTVEECLLMRGTEAIAGLMEARAGGGRGRQCLGVGGGEKWSEYEVCVPVWLPPVV